ncbi:MAG: Abortive infection protein [Bacteroidetes bacterium]|nr:MAG: Abortive infection protein [Bacteroidota bacterium]
MEKTPFFNRYLEAGREGKNDWWRYLVGILLVFFIGYGLVGQIPILILIFWGIKNGYISSIADPELQSKIFNPEVMHLSPHVIMLTQMALFVGGMLVLWIVVRFMHRKRFMSIVTASRNVRVRRIGFSFITYIGVMLATLTIQMRADPTNYEYIFQLKPFLITILIGLTLLPIQTWWEEFFVRGYMLQGFGLAVGKALIPLLTTSLLFGLLHMMNPEAQKYGWEIMLPQYVMPGLIFGLLTVLDEGQELAMGAHWANNLFLISAVTSSDYVIQASAIYRVKSFDPVTELWIGALQLFTFLAIMWATYKWNPKKLYK